LFSVKPIETTPKSSSKMERKYLIKKNKNKNWDAVFSSLYPQTAVFIGSFVAVYEDKR
jgi:hypothetical protein